LAGHRDSRAQGRYLGTVTASTAEEAVKVAAKEFELTPERQKRLIAQREA
jgi:hypothetical protein